MTDLPPEELSDLLASYALGALDADDARVVEQLLERSPSARAELEQYRATVRNMPPRTGPPPTLWKRIADEAFEPSTNTLADQASVEGTHCKRRSWRDKKRPLLAVAGVAVVAVVALVLTLDRPDGIDDARLTASLMAAVDAPPISGTAKIHDSTSSDGVLVLDINDLPASPAGHHYRVWVLRAESNGAMEAVGAFAANSSHVELEVPLPGPGTYQAVDISLQEDGGSPEHSGLSVAGGTFSG